MVSAVTRQSRVVVQKVQNPPHGSAGICSRLTYKQRRWELSKSHQRQLVDCSGPAYEGNLPKTRRFAQSPSEFSRIRDRSPRPASDSNSSVL